jgi:hypothetical protein
VERPDFSFPNTVPGGDPIPDVSFASATDDRAEHVPTDSSGRARLDAERAYATLGLPTGASMADVGAAYRWLSLGVELERRKGSPDSARRVLNAAYATLRLLAID